jgi:protein-tyrosine-phosphatase
VYYRAELHRCRDLIGQVGPAIHPGLRLAAPSAPQLRPRTRPTARVLFLCTGNSARSQIAEALLVARSGGTIDARSAGSHPKPLHPDAVTVAAEHGVDIACNSSKHLRRFARMRFQWVITVCDKVREICPDFPGAAETAHWSIGDPAAVGGTDDERLTAFRRVADELEDRIELLVAAMATGANEGSNHA